jgi:pyridoxamine 5'-phosphate oxidase
MRLPEEAIRRFEECMQAAERAGEIEPTAMTVATLGVEGGVSARMLLMKEFTPEGFVFYTNQESIKGGQLAVDPHVALVFYWKRIEQSVRVEGQVEVVDDAQADAYFASRDRGSQLGAWASLQSRPTKGRSELLKRVAKFEAKYLTRAVPRPPHWSGYRVLPEMIEFWYGRRSRLHDRYRYTFRDGEWVMERLFP